MKLQLEKQIEKDTKEIEQLAERVRVLEQRLGKGDYDPLTTRVSILSFPKLKCDTVCLWFFE
jgi:CII-binding regulator of phage lambda lysogenization HflD